MSIDRTGSDPAAPASDAAQALRILGLLHDDDVDGAIEAGLARFVPLASLDDATNGALAAARDRLLAAWAARERHRGRALRLERIAQERKQARTARAEAPVVASAVQDGSATSIAPAGAPPRPALPAAAAAALARARARASGNVP